MIAVHRYNHLINTACDKMDVDRLKVESRLRQPDIAHTRFMIWRIMRNHYFMTLQEIGHRWHRDHTTIMHGIECLEEWFAREPTLELIYQAILAVHAEYTNDPIHLYGIEEAA